MNLTDFGHAYNEGYRDGSKAEREKLKVTIGQLQAKIDRLTLEHFPDQMTEAEWEAFKKHQKVYLDE